MTRARDLADYISTGVSDTELDVLDGVTAGTVTASKALVVDANKDIASVRNITVDGTITLEGATADAFETTLTVTDPTADNTITLPDASGTVSLIDSSGHLIVENADPELHLISTDADESFLKLRKNAVSDAWDMQIDGSNAETGTSFEVNIDGTVTSLSGVSSGTVTNYSYDNLQVSGQNSITDNAELRVVSGTGTTRFYVNSTDPRVGIGTATPAVSLDIATTDAIQVPDGTTAQRPSSPANGMFRYNTTDGAFEGYAGGAWGSVGGGAWSLVDEVTVSSNTNTVDLEGMDSTYKVYAVVVSLAAMDSGENVFMRFKNQGSYDTSAIYSNTSNGARSGNNAWYIQQRENLSAFEIMNISSISQAGHSCMMYIYNASSSTVRTNIQGTWMAQESGQAYMDVFAGSYSRANSNAETDGIRFFPNNRNWTAGNFRLYGIGG